MDSKAKLSLRFTYSPISSSMSVSEVMIHSNTMKSSDLFNKNVLQSHSPSMPRLAMSRIIVSYIMKPQIIFLQRMIAIHAERCFSAGAAFCAPLQEHGYAFAGFIMILS